MTTSYTEAFGSRSRSQTNGSRAPRPGQDTEQEFEKSEFWMNVGKFKSLGATEEDGTPKDTFVTVRKGIPLDAIKPFKPEQAPTENMAVLREEQNWLLEDIMEAVKALAPGETRIVNLQVELKRTKGEIALDTSRQRVRNEL